MRWPRPGLRRALRLGLLLPILLPILLLIHPVAGHGQANPEAPPSKTSAKSTQKTDTKADAKAAKAATMATSKDDDGRPAKSGKAAAPKPTRAAAGSEADESGKATTGTGAKVPKASASGAVEKSARGTGSGAAEKTTRAAGRSAAGKTAKASGTGATDKTTKASGTGATDKTTKAAGTGTGDKTTKADGSSAGDKTAKAGAGGATDKSAKAPQKSAKARGPVAEPCTHTVKAGETVSRVAARYGVSRTALLAANRLPRPDTLTVGKRLTIPGCAANRQFEGDRDIARREPPPTEGILLAKVGPRRVPTQLFLGPAELNSPSTGNLLWPVAGPIVSGFGLRRSGWHAGLDIKADVGTPILASAAGTVMVSGWERAYGRVVKIEHDNGFVTVYAHNLQNLVVPGDRVDAGTVIATVGRTGRSTAYHLHFEVRRDGMAYNPLHVLPERDVMVARSDESVEAEAEEAEDESPR